MVSADLNQNGDGTEDLTAEQILSRDSSDASDVFEESELLPRVGDVYQAEIPSLITGPEYDSYLKRLIDAENKDHVPFDFLGGLSVPVTWIRNINKVEKNRKDEKLDFSTQPIDAPSIFGSVRKTTDPYCVMVPGVCHDLWNDIEEASFILGLYIFKKKFGELKNFIGSKNMGDILFFYYTKFYRSTGFNRWSTCTEGRKEKCRYGTWLFSGLKHQELLSRLLSQVSVECQKMLREVTKTYAKKDMSLIEYVFSIKSVVGLETLVDAVAIGKGKQDLTSMVIRPERIPVGEACSILTHAEIVKFLTGGYRLNKAQSKDLFWGAVWPRLLARGWHSEQPKSQRGRQIDSLVFLTPGIEKFSRKLVKGNHFFDSVTAVMRKVRFEPELLELNTENDEGEKKEKKGLIEETKEQQTLPKKHGCYLQPRTPICGMDVIKFTDTSLDSGNVLEFRDLRTLPMDTIEPVQEVIKEKNLYDNKQAREPVNIQSSQKLKRNNLDTSVSVMKKHRSTCSTAEIGSSSSTFPLALKFGDGVPGCCSDVLDPNSKTFSQVGSSQCKWTYTSSPRVNPCWSTRGSQDDDCYDQENSRSRMFINMNLPQQPVVSPGGVSMTDSKNIQADITSTQQYNLCAPKTSANISVPEQPANINSRRQSTRKRPPTARALEALVNGDLTAKTRRKKDAYSH